MHTGYNHQTVDERAQQYLALVDARKACRFCSNSGLINASVIRDGEIDSAHIGPWSGWLGDLHARVMVIGQDWGDQRAFENQAGRNWSDSATNRMLIQLMAHAGIVVPEGPGEPSGVFLTNAVLCFRTDDGCQGSGKTEWFQNCGPRFLRPQIELVKPQVVVCLGRRAYAAVLSAYELPPVQDWRAAVEGSGIALAGGPIAFAVYHCSQVSLNINRKEAEQVNDWKRLGAALARMSNDLVRPQRGSE